MKQQDPLVVPPRSFVDVPYTFEVHRLGPFEDEFKLFVEVKGTLREIVVKVRGTGKAPAPTKGE